MKKILAIFVVMVMCFTSNVSEVDAATKTKGIIYYRIELAKTATLTSGTYFLSNGDSFEDLSYVSFTFPTNISDACVRVTGPLNPGSYYGKDKGSTKYNIKGFPVDVVQKDIQFDNCPYGHLFAPAADVDLNGVQQWRYFCTNGGAQNKGLIICTLLKP